MGVGVRVAVGLGVLVGKLLPGWVGTAVVPVSGVGLVPPPITIERGVSGQVMISWESDARFTLVSASLPVVQSKESEVVLSDRAVRVRVAKRVPLVVVFFAWAILSSQDDARYLSL